MAARPCILPLPHLIANGCHGDRSEYDALLAACGLYRGRRRFGEVFRAEPVLQGFPKVDRVHRGEAELERRGDRREGR